MVYAALNDSLYLITRAIKSLITSNRWDSLYPAPTKPYTTEVSCPMKDAKSLKSQNTAGIRLLETMQKVSDCFGRDVGADPRFSSGKGAGRFTKMITMETQIRESIERYNVSGGRGAQPPSPTPWIRPWFLWILLMEGICQIDEKISRYISYIF